MNAKTATGKNFRIDWKSDDKPPVYATNTLIQHSENEFLLSFYAVQPPLIVGAPEEVEQQLMGIDSIPAIPVAKVFLSPAHIPQLIQILADNYNNYLERQNDPNKPE